MTSHKNFENSLHHLYFVPVLTSFINSFGLAHFVPIFKHITPGFHLYPIWSELNHLQNVSSTELIYLHLFTKQFHKDSPLLIRMNVSYPTCYCSIFWWASSVRWNHKSHSCVVNKYTKLNFGNLCSNKCSLVEHPNICRFIELMYDQVKIKKDYPSKTCTTELI